MNKQISWGQTNEANSSRYLMVAVQNGPSTFRMAVVLNPYEFHGDGNNMAPAFNRCTSSWQKSNINPVATYLESFFFFNFSVSSTRVLIARYTSLCIFS